MEKLPAKKKPSNLHVKNSITSINKKKSEINAETLKLCAIEKLTEFENYYQIYTDGSKVDNLAGIGIYMKDTSEKISEQLLSYCSIKTCELFAIYKAMRYATITNKTRIAILTDSKSACDSLLNRDSNHVKYLEQKIINLAEENQHIEYIIQWIPAHVGIAGNELADETAKKAVTSNISDSVRKIKNKVTIEDSNNLIKKVLLNKWSNEYVSLTQNKGIHQAKVINHKPSYTPWFTKSNLSNQEIKLISRLRSGHAYDKRFLKMLNIIDCDKCENCDCVDNFEHTILFCDKYTSIRSKYNLINAQNDLAFLLSKNDQKIHKEIVNFLKEIDIKI